MTYIHFTWNNKELSVDDRLGEMIASLVWNSKNDNDSVIPVSGSRMVRSGKSTIAQQCAAWAAYLTEKWNMNDKPFSLDNIYWDSNKMIEDVINTNTKHNIYILDEAYFELSASKNNAKQQKLLDFFNEVGFKNNMYFLCIPDYFALKEMMAVGRSEMLLNTYRSLRSLPQVLEKDGKQRTLTIFERGFFQAWNRDAKNLMFDIFRTSNRKNYFCVKESIPRGRFTSALPFDKEEYVKRKEEALQKFKKPEIVEKLNKAEEKEKAKAEEINKPIEPEAPKIGKRDMRLLEEIKILTKVIHEKTDLSDDEIARLTNKKWEVIGRYRSNTRHINVDEVLNRKKEKSILPQ